MEKWKPACGELYYYISQSGSINSTKAGTGADTVFKIATGNYFKTYDLCKNILKKKLDELELPYRKYGKLKLSGFSSINGNKIPEKYLPHPFKY